jgi:hypothetical protein
VLLLYDFRTSVCTGTDHCFDYQIRETADAMVKNGMKDLGFEWIVLDEYVISRLACFG